MAHEIAKIILEQADALWERQRAVEIAIRLGMPLFEIEEYLDWLQLVRASPNGGSTSDADSPQSHDS